MKLAIPEREGRVSPVFDAARHLAIVEMDNGRIVSRSTLLLAQKDPLEKARHLARSGVTVLICGAISRPLVMILAASRVRVHPFVCGPVEEVIQAYTDNQLDHHRFRMPGVHGMGQRYGAMNRAATSDLPKSTGRSRNTARTREST